MRRKIPHETWVQRHVTGWMHWPKVCSTNSSPKGMRHERGMMSLTALGIQSQTAGPDGVGERHTHGSLVRLSVGVEDVRDLIDDLKSALEAI